MICRKMGERRGAHDDKPAVSAKGTVRPSAKPMMASWMTSPELEWFSLWFGLAVVGSSERGRECCGSFEWRDIG